MSYLAGPASPKAPPMQSPLLDGDLGSIQERMNTATARITEWIDRTIGSVPEQGNKTLEGVPSGSLGQRLHSLRALANRLEAQADRLEAI